jgi:serine/threonine/tyrosine-interacting protein
MYPPPTVEAHAEANIHMMAPPVTTEKAMSHSDDSPYIRTHEYSGRIPAKHPFRVAVPPVSLYDQENSQFDTVAPASHDFEDGEFVQRGFFQVVDPSWFAHKSQSGDWSYEMRREAQQVLPFLYLGPLSCAKDRTFLQREDITLLLAVRSKQSAMARLVSGEKVAAELGIEADSIDVLNNQELIAEYPRAIRRINEHISSSSRLRSMSTPTPPRKVLVFCESGNERSASVVIAYMMAMLNLNMQDALWTVQHRRFCVCIEEPMRQLLHSFDSILTAKRDVTRALRTMAALEKENGLLGPGQGQNQLTKKKRTHDEGNETEATMADKDMGMGMDEPEDKNGIPHPKTHPAPFQDK